MKYMVKFRGTFNTSSIVPASTRVVHVLSYRAGDDPIYNLGVDRFPLSFPGGKKPEVPQ